MKFIHPEEFVRLETEHGECLTQSGEMWLKPDSKPLAFKAEQAIAVAEVGFLWRAWLKMAGVSMQVIDYTVGGKAGLDGRLLGALPIMQMSDTDTIFRGEAMRYLAELMWNPDALLLNRWLDWRVINARTLAVATGDGARRRLRALREVGWQRPWSGRGT